MFLQLNVRDILKLYIFFTVISILVCGEYILGKSLSEPIFQGTACHPKSIYPGKECVAAFKSCCCSSTCTMWKEGRLNLKKNKSSSSIRRPCRTDFIQHKTAFVESGWYRYFDKSKCEISLYDALESDTILQKRMVIFVGDSMVRQLFHRMLWHLRGFDEIAEQYYHAHAVYARNQTHDRFEIGKHDLSGKAQLPLPLMPHEMVENPTIILIIIFDPMLLYHHHTVTSLIDPTYMSDFQKVVVTGIHFWISKDLPDAHIMKTIKNFNTINQTTITQAPKPVHPIIPIWYPNWASDFIFRNEHFIRFAIKKGYYILPSIEIANSGAFLPNRVDKIHYQCAYHRLIDESLIENHYKTPANGDCRDLFNLNLVQFILNIVAARKSKN
jgi:hypothetical protein